LEVQTCGFELRFTDGAQNESGRDEKWMGEEEIFLEGVIGSENFVAWTPISRTPSGVPLDFSDNPGVVRPASFSEPSGLKFAAPSNHPFFAGNFFFRLFSARRVACGGWMIRRFLSFAFWLLAGSVFGAEELGKLPDLDRGKGQIRVVTYNILGGRNTDGARDLKRVADVIRALNADLVAMQEVDVGTERIKGVDVAKELGALTGMQSFFAEAMPFQGGKYGVGALTRLPVESNRGHLLPARPKSEPRAAIEIVCRLRDAADAPKVRFIGTHLDHQRDETDRLAQVGKLMELFPEPSAGPSSILAGDLNADLPSAALQLLMGKWVATWPEGKALPTFPSTGPRVAIDHVLVGKEAKWKVLRVVTGTAIFPDNAAWREKLEKASDHVPVVVEMELQ
jgi:endonuclease/exonuclease/phosphatase family metal-dependent hydrolase